MQDLSKMNDLHLLYKYETIIKENAEMANLPVSCWIDPTPYFEELLRRLSLTEKFRWRDIKDELPPENITIVLLHYINDLHNNVKLGARIGDLYLDYYVNIIKPTPNYWLPLPTSPTEKD